MGQRVKGLIRGVAIMAAMLFALPLSPVVAQQITRDTTLDGRPNLNGIWKAIDTANWNLEAHSAEALDRFWEMGAIAAIPAGKSMLKDGGNIP